MLRVSTVRAPHHPNLSRACGARGKVGEGRGSHLLAMRAATPCLETCTRGAVSAARAPRGSLSQNGAQHVSARRQIHHRSARPICAPERSADPAWPSSANLVQHGPGVQLAHRACPAHRPPLRRPRVSARGAARASARGPRSAAPRRPRGAQEAGSSGRRAGERAAPWQVDPKVCSIAPCVPAPHTPTHTPQPPPARPRARTGRAGSRAGATGEDVGAGSHGAAYEYGLPHCPVRLRELGVPRAERARRALAVHEHAAPRAADRVLLLLGDVVRHVVHQPHPCAARPPCRRLTVVPPRRRGTHARADGGRRGSGPRSRAERPKMLAKVSRTAATMSERLTNAKFAAWRGSGGSRRRVRWCPGAHTPCVAGARHRGVGGRGGRRAWRRDSAGPPGTRRGRRRAARRQARGPRRPWRGIPPPASPCTPDVRARASRSAASRTRSPWRAPSRRRPPHRTPRPPPAPLRSGSPTQATRTACARVRARAR
jgi:hypothetical protein